MTDEQPDTQDNMLPPWKKYPELDRHSIGWRMGYGEGYMSTWGNWARTLNSEQLADYFKKYLPIPFEWLDWVARCCGHETHDYSEAATIEKVRWLEQKGMANSSEYMNWFEREYSLQGYLSSLKTLQPRLAKPAATYDIINKLYSIMHKTDIVKEQIDKTLSSKEVKEFMKAIYEESRDIFNIVHALEIFQEQPDR